MIWLVLGLAWFVTACLLGLLVSRIIRLADQRDTDRRAAMARHPSARR